LLDTAGGCFAKLLKIPKEKNLVGRGTRTDESEQSFVSDPHKNVGSKMQNKN